MSDKHIRAESFAQCPLPISQHDTVQLGHGSGGLMMHDLIGKLFRWAFDNPTLNRMDDQAVVTVDKNRIAISTDSFVIDPLFYPGGNIGELAVYGTVNDVAMCGARPKFRLLKAIRALTNRPNTCRAASRDLPGAASGRERRGTDGCHRHQTDNQSHCC